MSRRDTEIAQTLVETETKVVEDEDEKDQNGDYNLIGYISQALNAFNVNQRKPSVIDASWMDEDDDDREFEDAQFEE